MLKRSKSNSQIPLPKNDFPRTSQRFRSKSSIRLSGKEIPSNVKRNSSSVIEKLSSLPTGLKGKTSITTPTLHSSGRFSNKRSASTNITTPLSRSRSPHAGSGKVERNVNDKKWVSEQYLKVYKYLQDCNSNNDSLMPNLKPPTINTFVYVIERLLGEIDPRIVINLTNYKEVVLERLKLLNYPGYISGSLLKCVNTMHSWPQVMSLLAWLVDLVYIIKQDDIPENSKCEHNIVHKKSECITDYLIERYISFNNDEEDPKITDIAFAEKFANIFNIDSEKNEKTKQEITRLHDLIEKERTEITDEANKNQKLKKAMDDIQYEIDTFYMDDDLKAKEFEDTIQQLQERKIRLGEMKKTKLETITKLQETLKNQPCTYEEKQKMLAHIAELKDTNNLLKNSIEMKEEIKDKNELKLAEALSNLETQVYRLNQQLESLVGFEPNLKSLQVKTEGLTMEEIRDEIENLIENRKICESKINNEINLKESFISNIKPENDKVLQELEATNKNIHTLDEQTICLKEEINKFRNDIQCLVKTSEERQKAITQKISEMDKLEPNLDISKQKLATLEELLEKKQINLHQLKEKSLSCIAALQDMLMDHLVGMNKIRTEVFDFLKECVTNVCEAQAAILKDLHELDDLGKKD